MKITIASCYFMSNYGSLLQTYALQKYLEDLGHQVDNFAVEGIKKELDYAKIIYYLKEAKDISVIVNKAGRVKQAVIRKLKSDYNKKLKERERKIQLFREEYIKLTPIFTSKQKMAEYVTACDAVIVGSDQLWLPSNIVADYYTLNFVPDNINKIAYATSFGISRLPNSFINRTRAFLKRFQSVSVREASGQDIVKEATGVACSLVCDPTMLLTREEWLKAIPKRKIIDEDYIFCYFLGTIKEHRQLAVQLKKKTGLKIVALLYCEQYVYNDANYADETPYDIGPDDFVNLIRNAKYVLTDSFHGTVFSILSEKNFYTFTRHSDTEKLSTNSRIYNLVDIFGVRDRILKGQEDINTIIGQTINYSSVNKRLAKFREKSRQYLINALDNTEP